MIDPALIREAEALARGADLPPPPPKPKKPKAPKEPKPKRAYTTQGRSIGDALLAALAKKGLLPNQTKRTLK